MRVKMAHIINKINATSTKFRLRFLENLTRELKDKMIVDPHPMTVDDLKIPGKEKQNGQLNKKNA